MSAEAGASRRCVVAATFVPASHFNEAELEQALGCAVAPLTLPRGLGQTSYGAASGLTGTGTGSLGAGGGAGGGPAGPQPAELLLVVDLCGPMGVVAQAMQMLQTLLIVLRSLPLLPAPGATAAAGGASADAGTSTPTRAPSAPPYCPTFNVVICPGADNGRRSSVPEDLAAMLMYGCGTDASTSSPSLLHEAAAGLLGGRDGPAGPHRRRAEPAKPQWLFEGSRPVTVDNVSSAVGWVKVRT